MANYRTFHCRHCQQKQSFRKPRVHHAESLALSILTAGIYLILWAIACYHRLRSPWRCRVCRRSYRPVGNEAAQETSRGETVAVS